MGLWRGERGERRGGRSSYEGGVWGGLGEEREVGGKRSRLGHGPLCSGVSCSPSTPFSPFKVVLFVHQNV